MNIETIKSLYEAGCWNKGDIEQLVGAGIITQSQCNSILGITAPAETARPAETATPAGVTATPAEGIARARG